MKGLIRYQIYRRRFSLIASLIVLAIGIFVRPVLLINILIMGGVAGSKWIYDSRDKSEDFIETAGFSKKEILNSKFIFMELFVIFLTLTGVVGFSVISIKGIEKLMFCMLLGIGNVFLALGLVNKPNKFLSSLPAIVNLSIALTVIVYNWMDVEIFSQGKEIYSYIVCAIGGLALIAAYMKNRKDIEK